MKKEIKDRLVRIIEEKATLTLAVMRSLLLHEFPDSPVSKSTICRHLDGCLITLKLLTTVPREWNVEEVKEERDFGRWMDAR